ncbi:MAG: hypothetical protein E7380_00595 [Clostridiales bacterium]|nr:hypothetical protein [Clostridiales bacterium]
MGYFAVIDTETSWDNEVISIGIVVAEEISFQAVDRKYYVIKPTYKSGGMYACALKLNDRDTIICKRKKAVEDILLFLQKYSISSIFAYNAKFDCAHLPELNKFKWYDIMSVAAYKQYNCAIPLDAECCKTGRLKTGYGVESIMRMFCNYKKYFETHNAMQDALDELKIMELLRVDIRIYKSI